MAMRILLSCVSLALLVGCDDHADDAGPSPAAPKWLVPDPVSAIRSVLPDGWVVLGVKENASPFYYPEGNGKAIELGRLKEKGAVGKVSYNAKLWIMPAGYQDGGERTPTDDMQTAPPRLIAALARERLDLWGEPGDWPTIRKDILRACLSSGKTASEKSAAETP